MKTFAIILPLVAVAISCAASPVKDDYIAIEDAPKTVSHDVKFKQTQDKLTDQQHGGLGSSVEGYFPQMSIEKIGLGCGINWKDGQLHAGFDGGDNDNGIGGGFDWTRQGLSSIVGVHYKDNKINLNVTITEQNKVLFNVNGKNLDWERVLQQVGPEHPRETAGGAFKPVGGEGGKIPVGYYDRKTTNGPAGILPVVQA